MTMRVSAAKVTGEQGRLWSWVGDRSLSSAAEARPYVGDFFEEAARVTLGATRHQIDGQADYCPDLSVGASRFLECKAIGQSGQGMVFADRLKRDAQLVRDGATLTYLFWRHGVRVEDHATLHGLRAALAMGVRDVLAVPFERLRRAVHGLRLVCLLNAPGRESRMGYRLPKALIEELAGRYTVDLPRTKVYGCDLRPVTLTACDPGRCFPLLSDSEREAAGQLLYELSVQRLEVGLSEAPSPRHRNHRVREVMNANPKWYQRLCGKFTCSRTSPTKRRGHRHHDTAIKRRCVERSLERMMQGTLKTTYDFRVLPIVRAAAKC